MGRLTAGDQQGSDTKSQLVTNICNMISNPTISCAHLHRPIISPFIDWYLLLQVEENVGIDVIRKQYHKFALLLHPDKNNHPKADIAFKLVYEAYACLKDNTRRAAFDLKRGNSFCKECSKIPHASSNPTIKTTTTKLRGLFTKERSRPSKILQGMNDIKARFREEAGVIEKCLKVNAASPQLTTHSERTSQFSIHRIIYPKATLIIGQGTTRNLRVFGACIQEKCTLNEKTDVIPQSLNPDLKGDQ